MTNTRVSSLLINNHDSGWDSRNMFRNLFGRKTSESNSNDFSEHVNKSVLKMRSHGLFMHYFDPAAKPDFNDPSWQNQGVFFWSADEKFERKSLPDNYGQFEKRFFLINQLPDNISMSAGTVMPWFGKPGGGNKYFFTDENGDLPIGFLAQNSYISYVQVITLTKENLNILTDRDNYFLLLDNKTVLYQPASDKFYFNEKETSLGGAYKQGGVKILKYV